MGYLPTPETSVNDVKFFKIEDDSYDSKTGKTDQLISLSLPPYPPFLPPLSSTHLCSTNLCSTNLCSTHLSSSHLPSLHLCSTHLSSPPFLSTSPTDHLSTDTWGSDRAAASGNSYTLRIPSELVPGTYVLRTEMIALHANTPGMKMSPVSGPEFYLHCFNIEVTGNGTAKPEGSTFPGTYKADDPGVVFVPYFGDGDGRERNGGYVSHLIF